MLLVQDHFRTSSHHNLWDLSLCTAQYEEDRSIIPSFFHKLPNLTGSTATYFPHLRGHKKLPLVKDIFSALDSLALHGNDIVIYSNVDIAVQDFFYSYVVEALERLDGLVINRRDLPKSTPQGHYYTASDITTLYKLEGKKHPGYDCFVCPYNYLADLHIGDVFLGYPPVGSVIKNSIETIAQKFEVTRDDLVTFHIGEDVSWRKSTPTNDEYYCFNIRLARAAGHDFKKMKLL